VASLAEQLVEQLAESQGQLVAVAEQ